MKSILALVLLFVSVSASAYAPDWSARDRAAISSVVARAQAETGGYCDHEDLRRRPAGYDVQVYCEATRGFLWYFVEVERCQNYRGEWYWWTSTPVRLPLYR